MVESERLGGGSRRRAPARFAGDAGRVFPCTKNHGKGMNRKRRGRENLPRGRRGGRHGGGGDRRRGRGSGGELRRRRCCGEGGEKGRGAGWRGGLGAPFIVVSGEGEGREGGGGEVGGRPLMAARCGRLQGEEGAGTAVGECGGALKTEWRRRTGAGSRGGGAGGRGWPAAARGRKGRPAGGRRRCRQVGPTCR
jgi:hypothetical protein